jgi:L-threonylcarbamoyladenylate synthase
VPESHQFVLSPSGDLTEAARNIYAGLHFLDDLGLDILLAEKCPGDGIGPAINDRLQRAAFKGNGEGGFML